MSESFGTSFASFLKERLTNPVISSFAVSWSLYNYKFFVILFSRTSVSETFSLIKERFPDLVAVMLHGVIVPSVFAAIYLFGAPYVTAWYYGWLKDRQRKVDEARYALESSQRLTEEESRIIRAQVRRKDVEIDQLAAEIGKLKGDLKEADRAKDEALLKATSFDQKTIEYQEGRAAAERMVQEANELAEKRLAELSSEMKSKIASAEAARVEAINRAASTDALRQQLELRVSVLLEEIRKKEEEAKHQREADETADSLNATQLKIIEFVGNHPMCSSNYISSQLNISRLESDYWVGEFIEHGYIELHQDQDGEEGYVITQLGRRAWIRLRTSQ